MNVLIIGIGIIGTIYGWALQQAGIPVTHYVRPGKTERRSGEALLDLLDERQGFPRFSKIYYPWQCLETIPANESFELVIVPTNLYQTETALRQVYPQLPEASYLVLSANWLGDSAFKAIIPEQQLVLGYPDGGGTLIGDVYWTNLGAEIHLPSSDGPNGAAIQKVTQLFAAAGIQPDYQSNMLHWLWVHNATSMPIWAAYLQHCDMELLLKDQSLLRQAFTAVRECLDLCVARGVALNNYEDTAIFKLPDSLIGIMFKMLYYFNQSMQRDIAHAAQGFMEVQANYGQICATARELQIPLPAFTALGKVFETKSLDPN